MEQEPAERNPVRYPDPAVQILDPSFAKFRIFQSALERLATGFRWAEGPVWFGDGRYLLWSDIPNDRILRWEEETGRVSVFRKPSNFANGNTRDRQGRLVTCEHDSRRVTRTEYDGTITVLLDRFDGRRLNSPNDVVVKSDDSIWFTDPPFGILGNYEGHVAEPELPTSVYRLDGRTGRAAVVTDAIPRPNGLCFSPDESRLYVVVSGAMPREIRVFDVVDGGTRLANERVFINTGAGIPDGMRRGGVQPGGSAHRAHPHAGAVRQPLLRRSQAQPALPRGQPVDLLDLRQRPGRAGGLVPNSNYSKVTSPASAAASQARRGIWVASLPPLTSMSVPVM